MEGKDKETGRLNNDAEERAIQASFWTSKGEIEIHTTSVPARNLIAWVRSLKLDNAVR